MVNIQFFQYQATLRIGAAWQGELQRELNECEMFIALINDEYHTSKWCQYEMELAFERWKKGQVVILPYLVTQTDVPQVIKDHIQCALMHTMRPDEIVKTIVDTVDRYLTETEQLPAVIRDRVGEVEHALERTAIQSPTLDFAQVVGEAVSALAKILDFQPDVQAQPQLIDGMCRMAVRMQSVFGDLSNFPNSVPLFFARSAAPESQDVDALKSLLAKQPESIALTVVPSSDSDQIQQIQQIVDSRIRQIHACDVVVLGHNQLKSIIRDPAPQAAFRRAVLAKVNILNYAPFVVTGQTPDHIFFGRESELRTICEHAQVASYAIIGGRRIGKTSLLGRLHRVRLPAVGFHTLFHDCSTTPTYDAFLDAPILDWRPNPPGAAPQTFSDLIVNPAKSLTALADKPLVLLLDEADKLVPTDRAHGWRLFNMLRALANSGRAQIVLSGERVLRGALHDSTGPLFNFANETLIGRLDYHAVEELVTRPMKQLEIELVDEGMIARRIYDFTSGHPNVVQRLCLRLVERLNTRGTRCLTLADVDAVIADPQFQELDFLQTYWEAASPLEKIITLVIAKEPHTYRLKEVRTLLADLVGTFRETSLPSTTEIKEALDRLVDLRSILTQSQEGYAFAVEAFPLVLANTTAVEDLLEVLVEQYSRGEETA
jgi:hypothetical protein